MTPIPQSLRDAIFKAIVVAPEHYEALILELDTARISGLSPPLFDLLESVAQCLRPMPATSSPHGLLDHGAVHPDTFLRASFRVVLANMAIYRDQFGNDDNIALVKQLFEANPLFQELSSS